MPMAYSMTVLAWSIIEYGGAMGSGGQLRYALEALKWGTDFMLLCHPSDNLYWAQVPSPPLNKLVLLLKQLKESTKVATLPLTSPLQL